MPAPHFHSTDGTTVRPRVVVVGTGHGGMEAVRALRKAEVDVLLVDRNNYHKFQPLLYQVATAALMPGQITQPARHIFRDQANADFRLAKVTGVDFEAQALHTASGSRIPYDFLVLAAGASTAYFGVQGAQEHGFPLKNLPDAINLRSHVLERFEAANNDPALVEDGALNFVIVGGGPTGVETAGALVELFEVLRKDFPALDVGRARILLVEMGERLFSAYKPSLSEYARRVLERRGVEVLLRTSVTRVTMREVHLGTGEVIPTHTVVWGAGVRANPLADALGVEQRGGGRVVVNEHLQIPGHPNVFVVGDMAAAFAPDGQLYPQLAQAAIQQGTHAGKSIQRLLRGETPEPFVYRDPGTMATIGRNAGIVQFPGGRTLRGRTAWMAWVAVHVVKLVGFRNRAEVLANWVYNYITWDRGPRLLLSTYPEDEEGSHAAPPVLTAAPTSDGPSGSHDPHLAQKPGKQMP